MSLLEVQSANRGSMDLHLCHIRRLIRSRCKTHVTFGKIGRKLAEYRAMSDAC